MSRPFGLSLKKRHSSLFVAYLESLNRAPHASIGAFSGTTVVKMKGQQPLPYSYIIPASFLHLDSDDSMNFIETRGNDGTHPLKVPFSEAILNPISSLAASTRLRACPIWVETSSATISIQTIRPWHEMFSVLLRSTSMPQSLTKRLPYMTHSMIPAIRCLSPKSKMTSM